MADTVVVKVRLQTQKNAAAGGLNMLGMFVHVYKSDGFLGLYRGVRVLESVIRRGSNSGRRYQHPS